MPTRKKTWRELAVSLVRFNPNYNNFECAEPWAHRTLAKHAEKQSPVRYSEEQLEHPQTHDSLWNPAQMQMVNTGWMHNYVRMYWEKKDSGVEFVASTGHRRTAERQVRAGRSRPQWLRGDCVVDS